jgi:hypothetical protein
MYSNPMNTLEDAHDVIRRYALDHADFGGGTAEGFAAWLYVPGLSNLDVLTLARQLKNYKKDYAKEARKGKNLDESLLVDAADLSKVLERYTKQRRELAECIRSLKFGAQGGALWETIAELATTPRRARQTLGREDGILLSRIPQVVNTLRTHKWGFDEAEGNHYQPGQDGELDLLIRMDIKRLDVSLFEAPPWAGKEPSMSLELAALFNFVSQYKEATPEASIAH